MRIDKFLWTIRLFKTRSLATKACSNKSVMINNEIVKASKLVIFGDVISVKENPIWRNYRILNIPKSRIGAKLLSEYLIEVTNQEDLNKLELIKEINRKNKFLGQKGRPTKKDRRDINKYQNE